MKTKLLVSAAMISLALNLAPAFAQDGTWQMGTPMPEPQSENSSAVVGNQWFVIGGIDVPEVMPVGTVVMYDENTKAWSKRVAMPEPAHHTATVAYDGKVYVFGGFVGEPGTKEWQPTADAFVYDPKTDGWSGFHLCQLPAERQRLWCSTEKSTSSAARMPMSMAVT
ncbi:Kelch repeat-containing protein [Mesorhizobium amorphae]|uniref:Kelch repeat-containing protein n=1 Tax=Mesorhizobium amorphae CCNWGS0123 TaxID=1082933 RepID=G6YGB2_9HYPH|nr:kelch repeat-containing protein [Mesorhizobium amorphae]ANT50661.1 hypothetical protein A6B35_12405 [Mesorhizobium amorphae CCNWGS0123]EHH09202.1 kelch repeat-containing protein [Mesorhizobium amorphae CCNWGS0123]GLR42421.1 hypothetical protein GCM10007880_29370 [Mesorhizobium amorphae]